MGKGLKQAYGGDGSDNVKKKGLGGFTAEHLCEPCYADSSCRKKLSFLHPEVKDKVQNCREYEWAACATAGRCICSEYSCVLTLCNLFNYLFTYKPSRRCGRYRVGIRGVRSSPIDTARLYSILDSLTRH